MSASENKHLARLVFGAIASFSGVILIATGLASGPGCTMLTEGCLRNSDCAAGEACIQNACSIAADAGTDGSTTGDASDAGDAGDGDTDADTDGGGTGGTGGTGGATATGGTATGGTTTTGTTTTTTGAGASGTGAAGPGGDGSGATGAWGGSFP